MASLHGIIPIVYTPFDADGRIVEADLRRLVDYLIAAGAHGLAAVGGGDLAVELHYLDAAPHLSSPRCAGGGTLSPCIVSNGRRSDPLLRGAGRRSAKRDGDPP